MSTVINSNKILNALIELEQNGYKFYQESAEAMEDGAVKNLFLKLAKDEEAHEATYKGLLDKLPDVEEFVIDEEDTFLDLLLELNAVVTDEEKLEKTKKVLSKREALLIAEKLERDTILFLNELIDIDKELARNNAYRIALKEEKRHLKLILKQIMDASVSSLML